MMRYPGLSPDNLPLSNGRRSHWRTCKEDDDIGNKEMDDDAITLPSFVEGNKGLPRFRSPSSKTQYQNFSPYTGNGSVPNSPPHSKNNHQHDTTTSPIRNGGDVLLQWGHRKRSRCSRTIENRAAGLTVTPDESSSSSTQIQAMIKVQRRSISQPTPATPPAGAVELVDKHKLLLSTNNTNTNIMPPPPSMLPTTISTIAAAANTSTSNGKGGNIKPCSKDTSAFLSNRRNLEVRSGPSGGGSGSQPPRNSGGGSSGRVGAAAGAASSSRSKVGKRSPPKVIEKHDHKKGTPCSSGSASLRNDKLNNGCASSIEEAAAIGMMNHIGSAPSQSGLQEVGCSTTTTNHDDNNTMKSATMAAGGGVEKVNRGDGGGGVGEVNEWPRVYIPLTRKEKEEDFLAMKGTKLPHRPKKRPKTVDKMLQYCFPGMWLSDVSRTRYEVKEKKCAKKKPKRRGGLKGMESMDSDSE